VNGYVVGTYLLDNKKSTEKDVKFLIENIFKMRKFMNNQNDYYINDYAYERVLEYLNLDTRLFNFYNYELDKQSLKKKLNNEVIGQEYISEEISQILSNNIKNRSNFILGNASLNNDYYIKNNDVNDWFFHTINILNTFKDMHIFGRDTNANKEITGLNRPLGVFFLTGDNGTGKTKMANVVSDILYTNEISSQNSVNNPTYFNNFQKILYNYQILFQCLQVMLWSCLSDDHFFE
jgi:hypothetical protein